MHQLNKNNYTTVSGQGSKPLVVEMVVVSLFSLVMEIFYLSLFSIAKRRLDIVYIFYVVIPNLFQNRCHPLPQAIFLNLYLKTTLRFLHYLLHYHSA